MNCDYLDPDKFLGFDPALGLNEVGQEITKKQLIDVMCDMVFIDGLVELYFTDTGFYFEWLGDGNGFSPPTLPGV